MSMISVSYENLRRFAKIVGNLQIEVADKHIKETIAPRVRLEPNHELWN